ncbi:MAG: methyltransferase domain-containing protein [Planctomycetes bacterium]|nr:methyltransferase domain-containing protein [Planctomycetota bacterium]
MSLPSCPVCGHPPGALVLHLPDVPVHCNRVCADAEEARRAPRAELRLVHCPGCSLLWNAAFEPGKVEYAPGYENSLHGSPTFRRYADELAHDLVRRHGVRDGLVLEIGCGRAEFLRLLCAAGGNRGLGFDPSAPASVTSDTSGDVRVLAEAFPPRDGLPAADLLCCRHVLEHVAAPVAMLSSLARALAERPSCVLFLEVPNALFTLRDGGLWDVIYEHCTYFAAPSLRAAAERAGFSVLAVEQTYGGQFLTLHARVAPAPDSESEADTGLRAEIAADCARLGAAYERAVTSWRGRLGAWADAGRRVVAWGAGSKGVTFLNAVDGERRVVAGIVDLNPLKHGAFVPGTAQPILAPDALAHMPPDVVLVMNPAYRDEIAADLAARGLRPEIAVLDGVE